MRETLSFILPLVIFALFQIGFFVSNLRKLSTARNLFVKREKYKLLNVGENSMLDLSVAYAGSHLYNLIQDLNEYIRKNRGTTDFSIIQNKTDRKVTLLYDDATSRLSFPIYIGLMGTFFGVFIGLLFFSDSLAGEDEISGTAVNSLINGVLISMSTSFLGLLLTTISHFFAADVKKKIDADKDYFFEFVQVELMPSLGVSMVEALNKLHQTINLFEPAFNGVIERFQSAFDRCTSNFGEAFEKNVSVVSQAVEVMADNMDKINRNVELNEELIQTMKSKKIQSTLVSFIGASQNFGLVADKAVMMEGVISDLQRQTIALAAAQKTFVQSLEVPSTIVDKFISILDRVTEFEQSVNALGADLQIIDLRFNDEIRALSQVLTAIRTKQELAIEAMNISDDRIAEIFNTQIATIEKIGRTFEESISEHQQRYQTVLENLDREMHDRKEQIAASLEEKFSLDKIQKEFSQFEKLPKIEESLGEINKKNQEAYDGMERKIASNIHETTKVYDALLRYVAETRREIELMERNSWFSSWWRKSK